MRKILAKTDGRARRLVALAAAVGLLAALTSAGRVRAADKRASPHEQATVTLAGKKVTIEYGRPSKKGRDIFGKTGLVPFGEVWRTGADEATTITCDGNVSIGSLKVPKGTYSLFTIPGEKEWTLVLNKEAKQWGAFKYDQKKDLGRVPLAVSTAGAPVEQFTIALEPQADKKSALLKLSWDTTVASATITAQ
jgi:hypothetical protein